MKRRGDLVFGLATGVALLCTLSILVLVIGQIVWEGAPAVSGAFLTESPSADMTGGGILPAIYGTVLMTLLMTVAVVPIGVATAIWLTEYASPDSRLAAVVRAAVHNLAGVPSVVFGLFGLGFFILFLGDSIDTVLYGGGEPVFSRPCVLWASMTLAVLTMPVVIVTCEEALRAVPPELREAAMGLGATRFQTVLYVSLPHARAGILTGMILAIARGAGEVAPIIFTGAANFMPHMPTDLRDMFMHLGYHVFALATQSPNVDAARPALFGTALVLLTLTFTLSGAAILIRSRVRRRWAS